jgi:sRNA-binding carbon storage regulator CsrA
MEKIMSALNCKVGEFLIIDSDMKILIYVNDVHLRIDAPQYINCASDELIQSKQRANQLTTTSPQISRNRK